MAEDSDVDIQPITRADFVPAKVFRSRSMNTHAGVVGGGVDSQANDDDISTTIAGAAGNSQANDDGISTTIAGGAGDSQANDNISTGGRNTPAKKWLAVSDVLCAAGDCVLKQRSQPAAVSIPLYRYYCLDTRMCYSVRCNLSKIQFSFFLNITSDGSCRNF